MTIWTKFTIIVFGFFLISTIFTFILMITQEGVGTPFIGNFTAVAVDLLEGTNYTTDILALQAKYNNEAKFDYDVVFMSMFFLMEFTVISLAVRSPKLPNWSFLTLLFFGIMMIVFGYSFIMDLTGWFISNFILGVFSPDVTDMPFYFWFQEFELQIWVATLIIGLVVNILFGKGGIVPKNPLLGG